MIMRRVVAARPQEAMRDLLRTVDLDVGEDELNAAIERSSYDAMRAHEDAMARNDVSRPAARIMRKGKVDEWKSWMTPTLAEQFDDERLRAVAWQFGYTVGH